MMKNPTIPLLALLLGILACGRSAVTATSKPYSEAPTSTMVTADLWYLTRGQAKSDQAWGVDVDSAGNIYTAGYYQSPPSALFYDMVIHKFAPDGGEIWRTQWGGGLEEKGFVVFVEEPFVYVGGTRHTSIALDQADMAVLALNMHTGEILWDFNWGQGYGYEEVDGLVAQGDYLYVSGWTAGKDTAGDMAVLKLNRSDGSLVWARSWGTAKFDEADGQMVVDENHIYLSGRLEATNAVLDGKAVIARFSKDNGDYIDHRTWGGNIFSDGLGMTSDGSNLYVVGLTLDRVNGGQIFLLKYDKGLNLLWQQTWGGTGAESARAAIVDGNGNILIAGNTDSYGSGKGDIVLVSFSPGGDLNWSSLWGGTMNDAVQGIAFFSNLVYLVGSTENSSRGLNDALLIKANALTGQFPRLVIDIVD